MSHPLVGSKDGNIIYSSNNSSYMGMFEHHRMVISALRCCYRHGSCTSQFLKAKVKMMNQIVHDINIDIKS